MRGEAAIAFAQAARDFDPSTGVPLQIFVAKRVLGRALTRYRKEWSYALFRSEPCSRTTHRRLADSQDQAASSEEVQVALSTLQPGDRRLIERLFWNEETEAQVAQSLGISQQAVSKRKISILRRMKGILCNRF
jgi:RNA polymerase sigma factor (sigma-70 family)